MRYFMLYILCYSIKISLFCLCRPKKQLHIINADPKSPSLHIKQTSEVRKMLWIINWFFELLSTFDSLFNLGREAFFFFETCMSSTSSWALIPTFLEIEKKLTVLPDESLFLCSLLMLRNKRVLWPNQDWHHWQQLQAACAVCVHARVCTPLCVLMSLCARVRVCQDEVTWLLSWAVREDPALCC